MSKIKHEITIEDNQFDFISPTFPRPTSFIRRFSQGFHRYYYTLNDETGEVTIYSSGTTLIKDGYAEDTSALEDWRNKLKAEGKNPVYELDYAAARGTIMHCLFGDFIQGVVIDLGNLHAHFEELHPEIIHTYLYYDIMTKDTEWLVKALLAFKQFIDDYKVKPLAIELMLKSDKYKVATPVDMVCQMTIPESGYFGETYKSGPNKGQPKITKKDRVVLAIVDFKSSKNGFFDKHYFQLQLNKRIVEENYPDKKVEALFNFSPKDFTGTTPTYNLKEQSEAKLDELCEVVFAQGSIKHSWKTPMVTTFNGLLDINNTEETELYSKTPLKEYLENLHGKDRSTNTEEDKE